MYLKLCTKIFFFENLVKNFEIDPTFPIFFFLKKSRYCGFSIPLFKISILPYSKILFKFEKKVDNFMGKSSSFQINSISEKSRYCGFENARFEISILGSPKKKTENEKVGQKSSDRPRFVLSRKTTRKTIRKTTGNEPFIAAATFRGDFNKIFSRGEGV